MRIPYLIRQAFRNLSERWGSNFILVISVASSFLVMGAFLLITYNLQSVAQKLRGEVQIEVYLKEEISPDQTDSLFLGMKNLPEVEKLEYRSKEKAFTLLEGYLGKELLEGIDPNPLPASFLLSLRKEHRGFEQVAFIASKIRNKNGVEDVEFGGDWLKKLDQAISIFFLADLVFGIFITIAVSLIVSNFMRVVVISQAESIQVMSLLGARTKDIALPLLIQGMLLGGVGAMLGLLLVWVGYLIFSSRIITITFLPFNWLLGLMVWGMILGSGGSLLSIRKHLYY